MVMIKKVYSQECIILWIQGFSDVLNPFAAKQAFHCYIETFVEIIPVKFKIWYPQFACCQNTFFERYFKIWEEILS